MELIILAIILSIIRKGNINNFRQIKIHWIWGIFVYVLLSMLISISSFQSRFSIHTLIIMEWLGYLLLTIVIIRNYKLPGGKIIVAGACLNLIAMGFNGGLMPVSEGALLTIGKEDIISLLKQGLSITHVLLNSNSKMSFLGDIIAIPRPWIYPRVISIGDIFISVGVAYMIWSIMKKKEEYNEKI
ncbi:MAG: DUF5317 domain-containing protein [Tissierellia bacterium]|nr:DUF5317 domain-containing protein [Tissierellia bacterium]